MMERTKKSNAKSSRMSRDSAENGRGKNDGNTQKRRSGETPRDKPVEEEADKDVKSGGAG